MFETLILMHDKPHTNTQSWISLIIFSKCLQ